MSDNKAMLMGYTHEVMAYEGDIEFHLFVKPGQDLADYFRAYDADACEFIGVNGWLFTFEDVIELDSYTCRDEARQMGITALD